MSIYRRLVAWQLAMELYCDVCHVAENFPSREQFSLTQQLCKAALSIPSNIAEGRGRATKKDFRHFLMQARGSLYEVETQITAACRRRYITAEVEAQLLEKSTRVIKVVNGLIRKLDSRPPAPGAP